jgi:hypothetical protein
VGKVQVGGTARVSGTAGTVLLTNDTLYTRPGKTYRLEELRQFDTPGSWWDYQVLSSGSSGSKAVTGTAQVFSGGTTEVVTTPTGDGTLVETWETTSQGRALQTSKVWWTGGNEMELIFNTPLLVTPETVEVGRTYSGSARFKGRWTIAQGNLEFFGNCTGTAQIQTKVQEHKQQTVQTGIYLAVKGETVMTASGYVEFRDHNGSFRHGPFTLKVTQTWWGVPGVGIVKGDVRVTVQVTTVGGLRCYYNVTSQRNLASLGTGRPSVPVLNDDFPGHSFTGMYPPDPIAAAGPSNIMAVVNSRVGIWSKTGTSIAAANLNEFFVEVDYGFGPFDPWIVYDRYSQRYIVMAEEVSFDTNKAFVLIAISTTSNPDDLDTDPGDADNDWYVYRIPATYDFGIGPAWIDYPKIAADADSLYITGNYFRFNDRRFQGTVVTRLDKTPMLTGMPGTRTDRLAPGAFTLQPAQSIGRPASAPQLFVDCGTNYGQGVTVWEMDDSNALTQVTTLSAPFSGSLAGATQPITTDTIDTVSVRLMNAVWRDNSLWATHTVDVDGDATVRWYQIDTTNGIYTLVQRSDINPGLGIETYMPAIAVDSAGNMAITYTQSSATQYASMMYTARRASDPLGFTPPGAVIKAGVTYYNPSVSTVERWGDYGGIAVDPSDDLTFWAFHEYVATTATWDTWWGTFAF